MSAAPITYLELVLWAEDEAARIDAWETALRRENKTLHPAMERQRARARKAAQVIEMVMLHREEFGRVIRQGQEALATNVARRKAATPTRATSSTRSKPEDMTSS